MAASSVPVVLLDADPGIDDAMAIVDLLARRAAGQVRVAGIVATAGNASRDDAVAAALAWVELGSRTDAAAGRPHLPEVPVHAGAAGALEVPHPFTPETHGPAGTGHAHLSPSATPAVSVDGVEAWVAASRDFEGELHAVLTGPASTLARALRRDPGLPRRLASLTVMGGAFFGHLGNTTASAEWNCHSDPESAQLVCEAFSVPGAPRVRWCGQNVTDAARIGPAEVTELLARTRGAEITRALAAALRFYFEFHDSVGEGYRASVHDPAVVALALDPGRGDWLPARVDVACSDPLTRGATVAETRPERWGLGGDFGAGAENASVLRAVPGGARRLVAEWAERHARWVVPEPFSPESAS